MLLCFTAKSQSQEPFSKDTIKGYETTRSIMLAGNHLKKYYNLQQTGNILQLSGLGCSVAGGVMLAYGTEDDNIPFFMCVAGGASILAGYIVKVVSNKEIGAAAHYMQGIIPINYNKKKVVYTEY